MRHLLVFALAIAAPFGVRAVGIDSVSRPTVPTAKAPSAKAPSGPPATAAAQPVDGPIVHRFEYDEVGNRTRHIDAEGRATRWKHDKGGRVTERILPGGQRETSEYNVAGELVAKTDFLGRTTRYAYDRAGRVESIDYPGDGDVSITYTAMGLRSTVTDGHGTTRYAYDRRDRLTGVEYPNDGAVAYEYDAAGNRTALITAHQRVSYGYDARNRLERVHGGYGITRFEYDAVGNRSAVIRPNGVRTAYAYDPRNRLTSLEHRVAATGALLFRVDYTLDANGQRLRAEEHDALGVSRTTTYTYDTVDRLVGETIVARDASQSRSTTWTYDKVGNRLTQSLVVGGQTFTTDYTYDSNDRLLTETTGAVAISYTYDANGNTRRRASPSGVVEYDYDDRDRLAEQRDASGRRTYRYDADGLRIGETFFPPAGAPITTSYVFDKGREYPTVIEEFVQEGEAGPRTLAAVYTYGDDLVSQTRGTATHFLHADGMSSTRLLTDATGAVTDTYAFDAFGNELARTGNTIVAHLYRGEQFDPNLGFYYLRARFYDPRTGRFPIMDSFAGVSMDPLSLHRYSFNHANPINRFDPSGHISLTDFSTAAAIIGIGSITIHAGFRLAEGDYRGAAREVARDAVFWALGAGVGRIVPPLSKAALGLFSRRFMVPLEVGLDRSGAVLTRNMEAVMGRVGMTKPAGWQAHHIVGEAYDAGREAMRILRRFKIDVNSPLNGVFLPGCGAKGRPGVPGLTVHCGKHVQEYERYVLEQLESVGGHSASESAVVNVLSRIRHELMHDELVLNIRGNL